MCCKVTSLNEPLIKPINTRKETDKSLLLPPRARPQCSGRQPTWIEDLRRHRICFLWLLCSFDDVCRHVCVSVMSEKVEHLSLVSRPERPRTLGKRHWGRFGHHTHECSSGTTRNFHIAVPRSSTPNTASIVSNVRGWGFIYTRCTYCFRHLAAGSLRGTGDVANAT